MLGLELEIKLVESLLDFDELEDELSFFFFGGGIVHIPSASAKLVPKNNVYIYLFIYL